MSQIFANGNDDYMFPTSQIGLRESGMVLESTNSAEVDKLTGRDKAIASYVKAQQRTEAMSCVLSWIDEGEFTYDSLDETIIVVADLDGDFEITEDEEAYYSEVWNEIPDALISLGADEDDVKEFMDGPGKEADKAAARMGRTLTQKMDEEQADDDELIARFAFGEDAVLESATPPRTSVGVFEATYKRKLVIKDGKKEWINKRMSGKVYRSPEQRLATKKAARKSHTGIANMHRKKSMKKRQALGM